MKPAGALKRRLVWLVDFIAAGGHPPPIQRNRPPAAHGCEGLMQIGKWRISLAGRLLVHSSIRTTVEMRFMEPPSAEVLVGSSRAAARLTGVAVTGVAE